RGGAAAGPRPGSRDLRDRRDRRGESGGPRAVPRPALRRRRDPDVPGGFRPALGRDRGDPAVKSPHLPLILRRLIGSILTLAVVLALLWGLSAAGLLSDQLKNSYGALAIGIAIALLATRLLQYLIFDVLFQFRRHVAAPQLLRQLVGLVIFGFGVALAIKLVFPEAHLGALFTTSAILTAVIGLALQDTLGNLFAGIALHLGRTLQVG